jgi:hypothetical protein
LLKVCGLKCVKKTGLTPVIYDLPVSPAVNAASLVNAFVESFCAVAIKFGSLWSLIVFVKPPLKLNPPLVTDRLANREGSMKNAGAKWIAAPTPPT